MFARAQGCKNAVPPSQAAIYRCFFIFKSSQVRPKGLFTEIFVVPKVPHAVAEPCLPSDRAFQGCRWDGGIYDFTSSRLLCVRQFWCKIMMKLCDRSRSGMRLVRKETRPDSRRAVAL